jgi:hypothetical protein
MAGQSSYGQTYGSAFRPSSDGSWGQLSQSSQYAYGSNSQHTGSAYTGQQQSWPSQAQASGYQYQAAQSYAGDVTSASPRSSLANTTQAYAQPSATATAQTDYRRDSYSRPSSTSGNQWPFRPGDASTSQGHQQAAGAGAGAGSTTWPTQNNSSAAAGYQNVSAPNPLSWQPSTTQSYQSRTDSTAPAWPSNSINPAEISLGNTTSRQSYSAATLTTQQQSNTAVQLDAQNAHSSGSNAVHNPAQYSGDNPSHRDSTGHKRKRTADEEGQNAKSRHNGLAVPARQVQSPQSHETLTRPSTSQTSRPSSRNQSTTQNANQTPPQPSRRRNRQSSGLAAQQSASPPHEQDSRPPSSTYTPSWAQVRDNGLDRQTNGRWISRTQETATDNAGASGSAIQPSSEELLTAEQIAALQNANGGPTQPPAPETAANAATQDSAEADPEPPEENTQPVGRSNQRQEPAAPVSRWKSTGASGLEDVFARKALSLPPLIGSHLHYSNKRIKWNPIPDKIDEIRNILYEVKRPIVLNSRQIAEYWPHMTNVWQRSNKNDVGFNGVGSENWECRQRTRVTDRPKHGIGTGQAPGTARLRVSKRQMLEGMQPCPMRIRLYYYTKHADTDENHKMGFMGCKCLPE